MSKHGKTSDSVQAPLGKVGTVAESGLVAPPVGRGDVADRRVVGRPVRLRGEDHHVAGEARAEDVGEEVVAERERLRVRPVVRNVGLRVLRVREVVAVLRRAGGEVPAVHSAVCQIRERAGVLVAEIARRRVRGVGRRDRAPVRELADRGPLCAGERAEVVVERVVLFDDHHDVLDGNDARVLGRRRIGRRRRVDVNGGRRVGVAGACTRIGDSRAGIDADGGLLVVGGARSAGHGDRKRGPRREDNEALHRRAGFAATALRARCMTQ